MSTSTAPGQQAMVIMGVSGAGKTTVGVLLARAMKCRFYDDFHSLENKEKMQKMIPLTDEDRLPWLETLRELLIDHIIRGEQVVLACSALRRIYRDILRSADLDFAMQNDSSFEDKSNRTKKDATKNLSWIDEKFNVPDVKSYDRKVVFIYLHGITELFAARVETRHKKGLHYMPPTLLESQMDTLELTEDEDDIMIVTAALQPENIVKTVLCKLFLLKKE
ncbi:hypothetical protein O6H91_01G120400 [Diphasiastrum complanatum]|uniref:Uncharacterized protein n=4 Tax=Diphasiastrum complanatum TaxID=34168 RepID=A0ACC2EVD1_DIPCM|nr:hypothetical protein O6H91_01G120400 [Diphasiastrum complanatum]